jgi:protein SCO1
MFCWNRAPLLVVIAVCFVFSACRRPPEKRFALKGKVVSVDREHRQVTLAHEEIKGFMDAMTMPFNVADEWAMPVLAQGQSVEATLVVQEDRSWIEGLRISTSEPSGSLPSTSLAPSAGEKVPDFSLINQDGTRIHLSQYRGHPLLLTFIYTRCPIPEYCPRTSQYFSEVHKGLQLLPASSARPHLLSISFDTDFDTPAVLREYGARYLNPISFKDWEFATGSPEEIKKIASYFGLSYWKESGQIVHSLVTALIGPDGTLQRLYQDNTWAPKKILAEFR